MNAFAGQYRASDLVITYELPEKLTRDTEVAYIRADRDLIRADDGNLLHFWYIKCTNRGVKFNVHLSLNLESGSKHMESWESEHKVRDLLEKILLDMGKKRSISLETLDIAGRKWFCIREYYGQSLLMKVRYVTKVNEKYLMSCALQINLPRDDKREEDAGVDLLRYWPEGPTLLRRLVDSIVLMLPSGKP